MMETRMELPLYVRGKVRDTYVLDDDRLLMVTTDRISAFDFVLPTGIPDRGRVLTQLSIFWFDRTRDLQENHLLGTGPSERSMVVRRAQRIDFECVVRGYLAGSAWAEYREHGTMAGEPLPAGLRESERLPEPLFTPATKAETGHDENVTFDHMRSEVGADLADRVRDASVRLYLAGAAYAEQRGLILADTKFEFGLIEGKITLADEVLTPDSSRYWPAQTYEPGGPQPSFDKQYVRDYLESIHWNKQAPAPALPPEVVEKTKAKYLEAFRLITGRASL